MQTCRGSVIQCCVNAKLQRLRETRRLRREESVEERGDLRGEAVDELEERRGGDAGDFEEQIPAVVVEEEGVAERHAGPHRGQHAQRDRAELVLLGADPGAVDGRRARQAREPRLRVRPWKRGNVETVGGEEEERVAREGGAGGGRVEREEAEDVGAERAAAQRTEVDEVRRAVAVEQHELSEVHRGRGAGGGGGGGGGGGERAGVWVLIGF